MGHRPILTALVVSLALGGCAYSPPQYIQPSPAQIAAANIGEIPADWQEQIKEELRRTLKDPFSAIVEFPAAPRKSYSSVQREQDLQFFWIVSFRVNAKNSYGAFTGFDDYYATFTQGRLGEVRNSSATLRDIDRYLAR